jgi:hypothetical protein
LRWLLLLVGNCPNEEPLGRGRTGDKSEAGGVARNLDLCAL